MWEANNRQNGKIEFVIEKSVLKQLKRKMGGYVYAWKGRGY
jgi:hypothetical protein